MLDDAGRVVVGVVSETDLALKRAEEASLTAADLMTAPAVTAGPEEPVVAAARRMHDRNVKRLPVTDRGGALVGIVTRADLLKVFLRSDDDLRRLAWQVDDVDVPAVPHGPAPL